jgi:peptidyl-prolyl cis-trans isomerase A (cyclophilin A)
MKHSLSRLLGATLGFALVLSAPAAFAQNAKPRVLLDTDRGPILIELENERTPITVANFLTYVDAGSFNDLLIDRVARDFIIQSGSFKANGSPVVRRPNIVSERDTDLGNTRGTVAMALISNNNGGHSRNTATSDFFFNTKDNLNLDADFTAFGRVIFGLSTLDAINATPLGATGTLSAEAPIRYPLIKRIVRTSGFPLLPLHSGAWFDPAKSGRGFNIEIANAAGGGQDPLLVVYWYDFHEGQQIWSTGVAPFAWGASRVEVSMQIASGAQFGAAFDPAQINRDAGWGDLIVQFEACDRVRISFSSRYGDGEYVLQRLTIPTTSTCQGG